MKIQTTRIFDRNRLAKTPIIVNRGGGGSSKSYSIAQLLVLRAFYYPGMRILILRKTRASLKKSVSFLLDFEVLPEITPYFTGRVTAEKNKTDLIYEFSNGSIISLDGVDDPKKLKSTKWHHIWFEEATDFTVDDFRTVKMYNRAKPFLRKINQIFLSLNPVNEFSWIKEKLIDSELEYTEIHSTFLDNPFLPEQSRQAYMNLIKEDENYYRVYALGEWGHLSGLIYKNWRTVTEIPEGDEVIYGLDFGFNSPSALAKITLKDQVPYIEEKIYKTGLTNLRLMEEMLVAGVKRNDIIYADCAEPARIKEMSELWTNRQGDRHPGFNTKEAKKSVKDGIDFVKRYDLRILPSSVNILKEIRAYKWKEDRQGNTLEEPVKFLDHLMDAVRYALYTHLFDIEDKPGMIFLD